MGRIGRRGSKGLAEPSPGLEEGLRGQEKAAERVEKS